MRHTEVEDDHQRDATDDIKRIKHN